MKNYYDVLGVDRDAPTEEIRIAYKILVKKFHPDVNLEQRDFFEKKSKELNEAHETLSNPSKREQYDIRLNDFLNNRNDNYQNTQKEEQNRKQEDENLKNQQEKAKQAQKEREEQEEFEQKEREEKRKEKEFEENRAKEHKRQNKNVLYGFLSLILIVALSFGGYILYRYNVKYDKAYSFYQDLARVEKHRTFYFNDYGNFEFGFDGRDKMYGFVDRNDNIVIRIMYDDARDFSEGLAAVQVKDNSIFKKEKWGFIDKTGNMVVPTEYESVHNFSDGLAGVECGSKWGFVDKTGKQVIGCSSYKGVNNFKDGYAWVTQKDVYKNEDYFLIDKQGYCIKNCGAINK